MGVTVWNAERKSTKQHSDVAVLPLQVCEDRAEGSGYDIFLDLLVLDAN